MPTALACPRCATLAMKEQDGDAIKISYDYAVWVEHCTNQHVGSLILCPDMRPLLGLRPDDEGKLVEVRGHRKPR